MASKQERVGHHHKNNVQRTSQCLVRTCTCACACAWACACACAGACTRGYACARAWGCASACACA
eukprot:14271139-Alexandrium_andersonii.AAC.1